MLLERCEDDKRNLEEETSANPCPSGSFSSACPPRHPCHPCSSVSFRCLVTTILGPLLVVAGAAIVAELVLLIVVIIAPGISVSVPELPSSCPGNTHLL